MTDLKRIRRREDLPPELKALSDVLDEYLVRMYGITSGWCHPVAFREFLAEEGLVVVSAEDLRVAVDDETPDFRKVGAALARLRAALPERNPADG